ncbi:MAG: thymidine kinase [Chitinophagaceae bacterium]|jgi:thymidine kinase|nr:MAG: thymidine kinase [Chitinophagaceae bacterium]
MFIEQNLTGERRGWIEVICGSMFSGKTEELIRRLKRAKIANLKVEIYKPATDTRYDINKVVSHDANSIPSTPVDHSSKIIELAADADVIGIDEAQFFDDGILEVCEVLVMKGKRVIVAGLDMDYLGKPFGQMPQLLSVADFITKLHAICVQCGHLANISYRTSDEEGTVVLGEKNNYEPRCRVCATK